MKKKGFTLVELLAVIIILAVIALIATPIVLNVIESSRKSAFESSVYGVIETIELKVADKMIKGESLISEYNFPTEELEFQGEQPTGGIAKTDRKGKVSIAVHNGKWCAIKGYDEGTLTIKEYNASTCTLEEDVVYYGFIEDGDYTVSLKGEIVEYRGEGGNVTIPTNFSGESYYKTLNIDKCETIMQENGINGSILGATTVEEACYAGFTYYPEIFDIEEQKRGYIEYRNIYFDEEACKTFVRSVYNESLDRDLLEDSKCSLENLYSAGFDIESLYFAGVVKADRVIVDEYKTIYLELEGFEYEIDSDKFIQFLKQNEELAGLSDDAILAYAYSMLPPKLEQEQKGQMIESGIIVEKSGYYQFENISFNKEKCTSILTELGYSSSDISYTCSYNSLIAMGYTINEMYETGMINADRKVVYANSSQKIAPYSYTFDNDRCVTYVMSEDPTVTTEDDALIQCNTINLQVYQMDPTSEEYAEAISFLVSAGIGKLENGFILLDNITVNETKCLALADVTEDETTDFCTLEGLAEFGLKISYDLGIIEADEIKIDKVIVTDEKNNINRKTETTAIGYNAFKDKNITGELDLTYLTKLERISDNAFAYNSISGELDLSRLTKLTYVSGFDGNKITSIKLPSSVETIGDSAFHLNEISGELDLSKYQSLKSVDGFGYNEITSIKLPNSVEIIASDAFSGNSISGELDLSNTKTSKIGIYAFQGNDLEKVVLPSTIKMILSWAFEKSSDGNQNLITIVNPSGNVFEWAFITSHTPGQNFATGTIVHENGNIEVTDK